MGNSGQQMLAVGPYRLRMKSRRKGPQNERDGRPRSSLSHYREREQGRNPRRRREGVRWSGRRRTGYSLSRGLRERGGARGGVQRDPISPEGKSLWLLSSVAHVFSGDAPESILEVIQRTNRRTSKYRSSQFASYCEYKTE